MTKLIETPPLIHIAPLTEIQEVNKHKRLGLQILNELGRIEIFVTKIEAVGKHDDVTAELNKAVTHLEQTLYNFEQENGNPNRPDNPSGRVLLQRYMIRTGLGEIFPKSSEYLGVDLVIRGGSSLEAHLRQMSSINQLVSMALQLQNDLKLTNHKFIAHQIALLYQCINQAGPTYSKFKSRVEERFAVAKEACNESDEPILPTDLQAWLTDLTTDIVSEALFSGRPMSQQTPEAAPLSDYINKVSSGNWDEQQPTAAS
ncbi:hypothetical protein BGX31_003335 [Mortierella sp. GBA43]|nr:hypothetical protein BGX31_003335 [Mortierella sp. GBA43]